MNILHVGPTPFFSDRGCHIRMRGLIRGLNRLGVRSALCTYHHGRNVESVETLRTPRIPGYTKVDAGPSPFKYLADILLFFRVCGAVARRRPDIIHGHLHEGALIGWAVQLVFFWRRIPLVFDMQGSLVGELEEYDYVKESGLKRKLFGWIERFIDHRPQSIVCSSRHSLDLARERFGVPADRLHLVSDGVDVAPPAAAAVERLRAELGLPTDSPVAVYTGSLLRVKGVDALHELMREIAERDLGVHLLIVGYPVEETRAFVEKHGLQAGCTLTGRVEFDRLGEYLALADMAIEPKASTSGEASGKVLNYMAAGLPVVCFDTINNREMLQDSGCYAPAGAASGLADHLQALAEDSERCRKLGARARSHVEDHFSWNASAQRLRDIYEGVRRTRS